MNKVLIVGGVAGGATAAARLRRLNENLEIIMFEKGEYISFANCGLPYYIGGEIKDKSALTLQTPESFNKRFNVDVRNKSEVIAINKEKKYVTVKNYKTDEIYTESYDKLILSPGAEPIKPNIKGLENDAVFTLRNIPDTYKIKDYIENKKPKSAVVVGGGYIGIEMAENLIHAGLKVSVVEFSNHVIAPLDFEMSCDVHNHIKSKGVNLILNSAVTEIEKNGPSLKIYTTDKELYADMVILSVGVKPETSIARDANIDVNERGSIIVNNNMLTSNEDIYAVGDAVEIVDFVTKSKTYIPLAGPANKQGRIAADNISGIESIYSGTQGTGILKCFDLTVATTGINEQVAIQNKINYEKSYTYSASHASYYPGAVNMSIKLLFEKITGKILGAQIVGYEGSDKRIDVIATAIRANMTIHDLTKLELAYAPPFSSAKDPVNMAGFVAENIITDKVEIFHWNQVDEIINDKDKIFIDVRTNLEYENGHINGFINIPVDELRQNLSKIDINKKIYVTCQIGLRGYIAARILKQSGFMCYNLSGGYRLWNSVFGKNEYKEDIKLNNETMVPINANTIAIDACGLQCPGPIMKLSEAIKNAEDGDVIEIKTTDPAFSGDVEAWCRRTGNTFGGIKSEKGISKAIIKKGGAVNHEVSTANGKNIIVFSGDLDKAIASFIIANAAASMGRKVSMFFTFWGLNVLRKPKKQNVAKDFISKMFEMMMPRGSKKLKLSNMNMLGIGPKLIRNIMFKKNINSLEELIEASIKNGVELVACTMSMDVMGIKMEELIDGVKPGGAAAMIAHAEESDMSLFI
jgi:CoA-disulfide reductase